MNEIHAVSAILLISLVSLTFHSIFNNKLYHCKIKAYLSMHLLHLTANFSRLLSRLCRECALVILNLTPCAVDLD